MNNMTQFTVERIYGEQEAAPDSYRVLVDRLWPRGISKEQANLNQWAKDIAPSTALRKWFNHEPAKYAAFKEKYIKEIKENPAAPNIIKGWLAQKEVTLLYGAKDQKQNEAVVLQEYLQGLE